MVRQAHHERGVPTPVNYTPTDITFAVCPIQQNWRELPNFLEYCNERGIRLFFNTVLWPKEASLRTMGYYELGEIVEYLKTVDFTEDTEVQRDNNANYLDLIQQILGYQDKAEYVHFKEEDISKKKWRLRVRKGNVANMVFSPDDPKMIRIVIKKAETKTPWHIQLEKRPLSIKSNHRYAVVFRACADNPRNLIFVIAKAYAPWDGLGLYKEVKLTSDWQLFQEEFAPTADDDNARLYFDVGSSDVAVELLGVQLRRR